MESVTRLDQVFPFNKKLSFLVPHEWIEEYKDGTYTYKEPGAESGWLHVSLITSGALDEPASGYLKNLYAKKTNVTVDEKTGNFVSFYEKDAEEDGVPVRLYYWLVAKSVTQNKVREAVFSYTVLWTLVDEAQTKRMVRLLAQVVSQAEFPSMI